MGSEAEELCGKSTWPETGQGMPQGFESRTETVEGRAAGEPGHLRGGKKVVAAFSEQILADCH